MMNRTLLIILSTFLSINLASAQEVCGSYKGYLEDDIKKYPQFYNSLEEKNTELEKKNEDLLKNLKTQKNSQEKKIIPVVVHVIHEGGNENISALDIQNALDALNKNINGQSDKFLEMYQGQYPKTPDIFADRRGVANLEFRLASLTPVDPDCDTCMARPTNGILRVESDYTNGVEPNNLVKSLSYWNSYQYLNIWVVKNIQSDNGGITLGYAQFPSTGSMSTDGVVILWGQMADSESTTLTHEVGHWLGLCHTWHCGVGRCGDDGVFDTPQQSNSNGFTEDPLADSEKPNPSKFPWHVGNSFGNAIFTCVADSLNPAGEMFMNYMDYTNDNYCTMFTKGQVAIFNETLEGLYDAETNVAGIGYRQYIWSPENIESTGIADGYLTPPCSQKADFIMTLPSSTSMCEGERIRLKGNKTMFENPTSIIWDFGDGQNDANTIYFPDSNLVDHYYTSSGSFDVTLTINYNETTQARATILADLLDNNPSSYDSIYETLIVQGTMAELNTLGASNISLHIDEEGYSLDSYWKRSQFSVDSLPGAFNIDVFQYQAIEDTLVIYVDGGNSTPTPDSVLVIDNGDSSYIHIDGGSLSALDLVLLETADNAAADSSSIITTEFIIDYLDSIVDYNFYYDTTVIDILTYIDSTYLTSVDSSLLNSADSSWSIDGLLNSSDSITIYFAQFNVDTIITISINTDTTSLSASDSLMFSDSDSSWNVSAFIGWVDTVRTFLGMHYYTKYNGYYADTLFYRGEVEKVTYVASYSNTCADSFTKAGFVNVNSAVSSLTESLYQYSFENEAELNGDWGVSQLIDIESEWSFNVGSNTTWVWENGVAADGVSSIKINGEDMFAGSSIQILSEAYDLSAFSIPAIKFSWSGASVNTSPVNELLVTYSDDCGASWNSLGTIEAIDASNAGLYSNSFKPKSSEWRDIVMTKTQLKNSNIRFRFEYVVNGSSNNFYLDNIMIGEQASLMIAENISNLRISVFPNPASGNTTITLENITEQNIEVTLINILGAEVSKLFNGRVVSKYHEIAADLTSLEKGIYFVKVISNGDVIKTDKLIVE